MLYKTAPNPMKKRFREMNKKPEPIDNVLQILSIVHSSEMITPLIVKNG